MKFKPPNSLLFFVNLGFFKIAMAKTVQLHDKTFETYISEAEILAAIGEMAERMNRDFEGKTPIFLGVLNGAFMFHADLVRHFNGPCEVGFVRYGSYVGTESTGEVVQLLGLDTAWLRDREVIILEDIVDTGNTVERILSDFESAGLKRPFIATLFYKPEAFQKDYKVDYVAMETPNAFIVGYGLDYDGLGRNLPDVYQIVETQ